MAGFEAFGVQEATLAIIIGTLAAIVFSLKVLFELERRIASIDRNIERMVRGVLKEELNIEKQLSRRNTRSTRKTSRKVVRSRLRR